MAYTTVAQRQSQPTKQTGYIPVGKRSVQQREDPILNSLLSTTTWRPPFAIPQNAPQATLSQTPQPKLRGKVEGWLRSNPFTNTIVEGLVGAPESEREAFQSKSASLIADAKNRGALRVFYSGFIKSDNEKISARYESLVNNGVDPERATAVAISDVKAGGRSGVLGATDAEKQELAKKEGRELPKTYFVTPTKEEQDILRGIKIWEKVEFGLDALDFTGIGSIISKPGKVLVRKLAKETAEDATKKIIQKEFKNLPEEVADVWARDISKINTPESVERYITSSISNLADTAQEVVSATRPARYVPVSERRVNAGITPDLQPLAQEARKYRSAEEFVEAQETKSPDYAVGEGSGHTAPYREEGFAPAHKLDELYPKDVYEKGAEFYGSGFRQLDDEAMGIFRKVRGNPDAEITIYRAVPKGKGIEDINAGDWVTITKGYAKTHGDSNLGGNYDILTKKVKADEIFTEANSLQEFGYDPRQLTKSQLTDLWNKAVGGEAIQGDQKLLTSPTPIAGEGFFASQPRTTGLKPETRMRRELEKARRVREEERILRTVRSEKELANSRRNLVRAVREQFGLSDTDLRKVSKKDPRLMSNYGFKQYLDGIRQKAVELADTRQVKNELMDLIRSREFAKVDNYRRAQDLPPIQQMTKTQMRQYMNALEEFQVGDEFLTTRQLEVVDRTNLAGVRTMREARERLVKEIKDTTGKDVTIDELNQIKVSALDNFIGDSFLMQKNPFYDFVTHKTQASLLNGEARFLDVQNKVNDLAKNARKSRSRGTLGTLRQAIIPKYEEIVQYLEAPIDQKQFFSEKLTRAELDYANYIEQYYGEAYDHLVAIKELYGSRFIDQYFTHVRKNFLEEWSDNGIINAFRNAWKSHKEDQMIANIIDQDTGSILPKSKFFQYTMQRTGDVEPSKNVTRVFLQYSRLFERKKMLDEIIPTIDIYTQSLTPKNLTPRGLEMDRSLKTFINKYLNNKKGRKETFGGVIKQNGPADMMMRAGNTLVSLLDLGFSIGASAASTIGEQVMTYQALGKRSYSKAWKRRLWDTGAKRLTDKNATKILKEAEPFIGRNIWTELAEPDKGVTERAMQGIFGVFSQSTVEANKLFLLGSLTKEELQAGKVSAERLAQMRLDAGRWRDMGKEMKSIIGATSTGAMATKYKGWALPIIGTTLKDVADLSVMIKNKSFKEAITSREAAELYRAIELSTILTIAGSYVLGEQDDDSFVGKLKARAYQESMTFLGGVDPTLFLATPRLFSFLQQLASNLKQIAKLEEYKQDGKYGDKGDLKGIGGLKRQFTPGAVRQFQGGSEEKQQSTDGVLPALPKLPKLPSLP